MPTRRARNHDGTLIPPMTLGNMRALGVRRVMAICETPLCGRSGILSADAWPDDYAVPDIALRLRCSRCGAKAVSTRPDWTEHHASGLAHRATADVAMYADEVRQSLSADFRNENRRTR